MIKTQIQLPETLYHDLKRLAANREWSLAEALRRAAEQFLSTFPKDPASPEMWQLPAGKHCGAFLTPPDQWTELAHEEAV